VHELDPKASDDAGLVARIVEDRDRRAAEAELYARFARRIYLFGVARLRSSATAEDLVQDVLTTVIERARAGAVREPDKLASFVLGTCRLLVQNRVRDAARRARILALYGDPRGVSTSDHEPADGKALERIAECMHALADRDRTVLLLTFYAELDGPAIARELGVEPSHVRVLRHRALARLQGCVTGRQEAS